MKIKSNKRIILKRIGKAILVVVGTAGLVTMAIVAPNVIGALGSFRNGKKSLMSSQVKRSMGRLQKQGLVYKTTVKGEEIFGLTKIGSKLYQEELLNELTVKTTNKWDGIWHIVSFDIPVARNYVRYKFTKNLKHLGLAKLQKSVWVFPFEFKKELDVILEVYDLKNHAVCFNAQSGSEKWETKLIRAFKL